ncbi:MAG: ribonuclease H-like domain-containing protein [Deltaproteobacteria bacterium]|nr:ribonuclease H-like domain-containing protein [Deltaproteobacteria bacterium]
MLNHTFSHIPGIGLKTERQIWSDGLSSWDTFSRVEHIPFSPGRIKHIKNYLAQSQLHLRNRNPNFFASLLSPGQHWRLFSAFRDSVAYLDIETTGLSDIHEITTISLYDGSAVYYYIQGENLDDFMDDILNYRLIITYNGKCFDVPFIENYFKIKINHAHIDLRYLLKSVGIAGGLKQCEKQVGLHRNELDGVDGYFAVLLWHDFQNTGNKRALETLLAYNIEDVLSLETLMVIAYNLKLKETPFFEQNRLSLPCPPQNPFKADITLLERIKHHLQYWR